MGTTRQKSSCRNRLQNGPHSLLRMKVGTHSPLPTGSHTAAHTAKHGRFGWGVVSLPSERFTRFGDPAWPGIRTANFAAFELWSGVRQKDAESLRNSDALMRVAVPRRRSPAGCVIFFISVEIAVCSSCAQGLSACARQGGITYPRRALRAVETPDGRLSKGLICRFLRSGGHH